MIIFFAIKVYEMMVGDKQAGDHAAAPPVWAGHGHLLVGRLCQNDRLSD